MRPLRVLLCVLVAVLCVRADSGLDAVYDDLAKRAYDTCTAQATDKPMRRACGILQEVVWDCWNGHQVVIQSMELSSPEVMKNLLLPTSKAGYENCYHSTLGWIRQNLQEGKKITFDELRQRYLHDFLQWYVKAIRGEPHNVGPEGMSPEAIQQMMAQRAAQQAQQQATSSPNAKKEVL